MREPITRVCEACNGDVGEARPRDVAMSRTSTTGRLRILRFACGFRTCCHAETSHLERDGDYLPAIFAFTTSIASGLSRLVRSPVASPVITRSRSTRRMILPLRVRGTVDTT